MVKEKMLLSMICPMHNESLNVTLFVEALHQYLEEYFDGAYEIICIDDGSFDDTFDKLQEMVSKYSLRVIKFSRNFGKEAAISAGLEHCKGDVAIIIDGDFQHPFSMISTFIECWKEGYHMVYGIRSRHNEGKLKRKLTHWFYQIMKVSSSVSVPEDGNDFRLLDRRVIDVLKKYGEKERFMKGIYASAGFRSKGVEFVEQEREQGQSKFGFFKLLGFAITGILSFSSLPLRMIGIVGIVISFIAFLFAFYIVVETILFGKTVPGYATLITTILLLGGIQIFSIGVLGEYIGRIFNEVKNRPLYIIEEDISHSSCLQSHASLSGEGSAGASLDVKKKQKTVSKGGSQNKKASKRNP